MPRRRDTTEGHFSPTAVAGAFSVLPFQTAAYPSSCLLKATSFTSYSFPGAGKINQGLPWVIFVTNPPWSDTFSLMLPAFLTIQESRLNIINTFFVTLYLNKYHLIPKLQQGVPLPLTGFPHTNTLTAGVCYQHSCSLVLPSLLTKIINRKWICPRPQGLTSVLASTTSTQDL